MNAASSSPMPRRVHSCGSASPLFFELSTT
jgi:hypothetical protein